MVWAMFNVTRPVGAVGARWSCVAAPSAIRRDFNDRPRHLVATPFKARRYRSRPARMDRPRSPRGTKSLPPRPRRPPTGLECRAQAAPAESSRARRRPAVGTQRRPSAPEHGRAAASGSGFDHWSARASTVQGGRTVTNEACIAELVASGWTGLAPPASPLLHSLSRAWAATSRACVPCRASNCQPGSCHRQQPTP